MSKKATLLLRLGTALITIGLALLLVSAIPSYGSTGSSSGGWGITLHQHSFFTNQGYLRLTPQQELNLNYTTNQTLSIYILNVEWYDFLSNKLNVTNFWDSSNLTESVLQTYLDSHPEVILTQTTSGTSIFTYTPDDFVDATVVFLNKADSNATLQYNYQINSVYAPKDRLQQLALVTMPLGAIFIIPGIFNFYRNRKLQKKLGTVG